MVEGQKFLVIRYANNIIENCVGLHIEVLQKEGFCWFGKIGTAPSKKVLDAILGEENPTLILYRSGEIYQCSLLEYSDKKPLRGYPQYYEEYLFDSSIKPRSYYKLGSIEKIVDSTELRSCVVSSRNLLTDTLQRSMSSFFYAEKPSTKNTVSNTKPKKTVTASKKVLLDENDCRYRKETLCTLKSCVNYKYECDRPSMCLKQKR